jgi:membrane-bound lytic murein transglycosylase D
LNLIRRQKLNYLDNFWDLYEKLPRETAFYVPKFLAVLHVLNNPKAHDMILPPVDSEIEIEEVTINKQVHLKTVAKDLDMEYSELRNLNPELRKNLTPKTPYELKVPLGKGEILMAKLKDIPVWQPPVPSYIIHRVQRGESLSMIATKYRTSVKAIMATNGLRRKNYLKVGWRLKIPTRKRATVFVEKPLVYASKPKKALIEYVVKKGDSLWQIANRFNTTAKTIQSLNRLESSRLQIGQVLKIAPEEASSKPNHIRKYRVRKGDSPYLIAKRHQMNIAQFLKLNNLTPRSTIFPGQIVQIKVD